MVEKGAGAYQFGPSSIDPTSREWEMDTDPKDRPTDFDLEKAVFEAP